MFVQFELRKGTIFQYHFQFLNMYESVWVLLLLGAGRSYSYFKWPRAREGSEEKFNNNYSQCLNILYKYTKTLCDSNTLSVYYVRESQIWWMFVTITTNTTITMYTNNWFINALDNTKYDKLHVIAKEKTKIIIENWYSKIKSIDNRPNIR
jgi:hypothetical protein